MVRFTIRRLFVVTLVAAFLSVAASRSLKLRKLDSNISDLLDLGARVSMDNYDSTTFYSTLSQIGLKHPQVFSIDSYNTFDSFGDDQIERVIDLPDLQKLTLRYTTVTDNGFRKLAERNHPSLRCLHLEGVEISHEGIVHLAKISQLRDISISSAFPIDSGVQQLRALRPDICVQVEAVGSKNSDEVFDQ